MARDRSGSLTGFACQAPSLGPYVPSSVLTDLRAEHQEVCGGTLAPCTAATALRPWPPLGGRWLRPAAAPGLRPAAGGVASPPWTSGPRLRWPRAVAAKPPPVAPPPPRPPAAYARGYAPAPVPPGHSVLGLALGRLRVDLAVRPPRLCGLASALLRPVAAGPPRTAPPAPCPPSSLGRLVAWAGYGLRSSRLGPFAVPGGDRSLRPPGPRRRGRYRGGIQGVSQRMQTGSDWRRPAAAGTVLHQV